ncbi:MAG: DNA glycosylase [Verrucomicrobiota bacterium]
MNAVTSNDPTPDWAEAQFHVRHYDLASTLDSGQAFRWWPQDNAWEGVIAGRWLRLCQSSENLLTARALAPVADWSWLENYLQLQVDLDSVLATFPDDTPLRTAVDACRGMRLLQQDPWECLASFILSSTKQIVQIRQVVALLCERFGRSIPAPPHTGPLRSFPEPAALAAATEADLRACKTGFRAPYLLAAARRVADGSLDLASLRARPVDEVRDILMTLPGVGRKIADCVLLYAYGFPEAFPIDVWIMRALKSLYFPKRRVTPKRLLTFGNSYFGPQAGYAQQYLFHYMRTRHPNPRRSRRTRPNHPPPSP